MSGDMNPCDSGHTWALVVSTSYPYEFERCSVCGVALAEVAKSAPVLSVTTEGTG